MKLIFKYGFIVLTGLAIGTAVHVYLFIVKLLAVTRAGVF